MAIISIIAAMDFNKVIGNRNKLPWYIPKDLEWFKEKTTNKPVIMGRKTHESIGKKLPGRLNIVLSKDSSYKPIHECVKVYNSLEEAIEKNKKYEEIMIIGGAKVYEQAINISNRMYITKVMGYFAGDAFFPFFNIDDWIFKEKRFTINKQYQFEFQILERK